MRRGIFNVIHFDSSHKVDVQALEPDKFEKSQLDRSLRMQLTPRNEMRVRVASPEDIVLQELLWHRKSEGASERQIRDVLGVLKLQRGRLDLAYLRSWARDLDLTDSLERVMRDAGS